MSLSYSLSKYSMKCQLLTDHLYLSIVYMWRKEHEDNKHTFNSNNIFKGIFNNKENCSRCIGESTYIGCKWKFNGILSSQWLRSTPTSSPLAISRYSHLQPSAGSLLDMSLITMAYLANQHKLLASPHVKIWIH